MNRLTALLEEWRQGNVKPLWGPGSGDSNERGAPLSAREKLFPQRDRNKDGKISKQEFMAVQKDQADGGKRFTKFDKNKDGMLDRGEFINMGK